MRNFLHFVKMLDLEFFKAFVRKWLSDNVSFRLNTRRETWLLDIEAVNNWGSVEVVIIRTSLYGLSQFYSMIMQFDRVWFGLVLDVLKQSWRRVCFGTSDDVCVRFKVCRVDRFSKLIMCTLFSRGSRLQKLTLPHRIQKRRNVSLPWRGKSCRSLRAWVEKSSYRLLWGSWRLVFSLNLLAFKVSTRSSG